MRKNLSILTNEEESVGDVVDYKTPTPKNNSMDKSPIKSPKSPKSKNSFLESSLNGSTSKLPVKLASVVAPVSKTILDIKHTVQLPDTEGNAIYQGKK